MLRFAVRRIMLMIPVLFGLSVLLFAWLRALPGDPARALLGEKATQNYRIETTNPGGHSSQPTPENAIYELADAVKAVQGVRSGMPRHRAPGGVLNI